MVTVMAPGVTPRTPKHPLITAPSNLAVRVTHMAAMLVTPVAVTICLVIVSWFILYLFSLTDEGSASNLKEAGKTFRLCSIGFEILPNRGRKTHLVCMYYTNIFVTKNEFPLQMFVFAEVALYRGDPSQFPLFTRHRSQDGNVGFTDERFRDLTFEIFYRDLSTQKETCLGGVLKYTLIQGLYRFWSSLPTGTYCVGVSIVC